MPTPIGRPSTIGSRKSPTVTIGQATGAGAARAPQVSIGVGRAVTATDIGAGALTIQELTGPDQRTVRLTERALPYKDVAFGVTHRIDEADYVGYSQTSQQALGAKWDETEMKGCWKTRFIGAETARMIEVTQSAVSVVDGLEALSVDNTRLRTADEVVTLFEDIARKGQPLRVQWAHVVRIGRLASFVPTWTTLHDVNWTMKFKWSSAEESAPPALSGVGNGPLEFTQKAASAYADLFNKTALSDLGLDPSLADRIDSRVGRIKRALLDMRSAASDRVSSVTRSADALRRLMSLSTFVRDEASSFIEEMDSVVYSAITAVEDPADLVAVPAGRAFQCACSIRQSIRAARAVKHVSARLRFEALRQLESDLLDVVLLSQDEDVADLSLRYYQTAEEGRRIRLFNNLNSNTAPAGTVILIPRLSDEP